MASSDNCSMSQLVLERNAHFYCEILCIYKLKYETYVINEDQRLSVPLMQCGEYVIN